MTVMGELMRFEEMETQQHQQLFPVEYNLDKTVLSGCSEKELTNILEEIDFLKRLLEEPSQTTSEQPIQTQQISTWQRKKQRLHHTHQRAIDKRLVELRIGKDCQLDVRQVYQMPYYMWQEPKPQKCNKQRLHTVLADILVRFIVSLLRRNGIAMNEPVRSQAECVMSMNNQQQDHSSFQMIQVW